MDSELHKRTAKEARRADRQRRRRRRVRLIGVGLLLLCLTPLLFVPVPVGFLRGTVQRAVRDNLGLDVAFGKARATLASGRIQLENVSFRVPNQPDSHFTIGRIEMEGPVRGLLMKSHPWPTRILVDDTGPIRARLDRSGPRLVGATGLLLETAERTMARRAEEKSIATRHPERERARFIPAIRILNAPLVLEASPPESQRLLSLTLHWGEFSPDFEGTKDYRFEFAGVLKTDVPAPASGSVRYHADNRMWEASFQTEEISGSFAIDTAGRRVHWRASDLLLAARANQGPHPEDGWKITLRGRTDETRLDDGVNGAPPLFHGPLSLTVNAVNPDESTTWTIQTARLTSDNLDLNLAGVLDARPPHRFTVNAEVNRFPTRVYNLAQEGLATTGALFDFPTTGGLRLRVRAEGYPDRLAEAEVSGRVSLDAVRLRHPLLVAPLFLEHIEGDVRGRTAKLNIARWHSGSLEGSAAARLSDVSLLDRRGALDADFQIAGRASEMLRLGRALQVIPPLIEDCEAMLRGEGHLATTLSLDKDGRVSMTPPDWSAEIAWIDGRLVLADWQDTIHMDSGAIRLAPKALEILRLRTQGGGLDVRWRGGLTGDPVFWAGDPYLTLAAEGESSVPALIRVLELNRISHPALHDIQGKLRATLEWSGPPTRPAEAHWKIGVRARDLAFAVPLLGDTGQARGVHFDAEFTRHTVVVEGLRAKLDDIEIEAELTADEREIRAGVQARGEIETVLRLFRDELAEFRGHGVVPGSGVARLTARVPLPNPEHPLPARWAALLAEPGAFGLGDEAKAVPSLEATLLPDGVAFWHEEMPRPITNVRGRVTADLTGLRLHRVTSQWGDIPDCVMDGHVILQGPPVRVLFDIAIPNLQVLDWIDGWGDPPDGRQARRVFRKGAEERPEALQSHIEGTIRISDMKLNRLRGRNAITLLRYLNWRYQPNTLTFENTQVEGYDGVVSGTIHMTFPSGEASPRFDIAGKFTEVEVQPFLTDLFGREEKTVGRIDGSILLQGRFDDLASYRGEGSVLLRDTRVLGGPIFPLLGKILRATVVRDITFSSIQGPFVVEDLRIYFEQLLLDSPGVRLLAAGNLGFETEIDMEVSAGFHSRTLSRIPGVGTLTALFHDLGSTFLKFSVTGTLEDPDVRAIPFSTDVLQRLIFGTPNGLPPAATTPPSANSERKK